jgi:hypothetical protein
MFNIKMFTPSNSDIIKIAYSTYSTFKDANCYYNKEMVNHKEILSRLKFIGKIEKGNKINTKHIYVQNDSFFTAFSRTFLRQDNRWNTVTFIQETIFRGFEILDTYERSSKPDEKSLCTHIIKDLKKCKDGINNIKSTYIADTKFCCDMDTILILVSSKLDSIMKKYPELELETDSDDSD